jgi:hypothetical protein
MLDPRDQAYVDTITDPGQREVVTCALATYRMPDVIRVGDQLPRLKLHRLGRPEADVVLGVTGRRPLVLLFGSYT